MSHEPLVDEVLLRRALRLDADEVPPRLDPVLLAAAAGAPARSGNEIAIAAAVAFAGGWLWSEMFRAVVGGLLGMGLDPLALVIDLAAAVAVQGALAAEALTNPVIPLAVLTAATITIIFERRGGRHAATS
jgi:hypothetical protein